MNDDELMEDILRLCDLVASADAKPDRISLDGGETWLLTGWYPPPPSDEAQ